MTNDLTPMPGKLYFTKDGQGNPVAFNEGSTGHILPIEVSNCGRIWYTNVGLLPIGRKRTAIADNLLDAKSVKY